MRATVVHRAAAAVRQWLCIALVAIPCSGWADAATGLAWLQSQVQGTGQFATPSGAASDHQTRCEVARTLLELSTAGAAAAAVTAALDAAPLAETVTEVLACTQWLQQQQSQIPRTSELQSRRTTSNGFAAFDGQTGPSVLDTAWALQALAGQWSSAQAEPTLAWLQQQQKQDGSFTQGIGSDLLITASVLRSLKEHRQRSVTAAAIADKAASYLLAQANAAGHWQSDTGITSIVYEAVHPHSGAQPALASTVKTWLLASQAVNGAWNSDDPWTTAVALRALALTGRPPVSPGQSALQMQLVEASTGTPIPGAQVTGTGAGNLSASSNASGQILLQGLAPGSYNLTATAQGYSTVQFSVTLQPGESTNLGVVQMLGSTSATTAVVSGTVRDSATGDPLGAATITVAAQSLTATTDAQGRYLITGVAPGAISIIAAKTGYFDASGQASALAGQTLNFSPNLVRNPAGGTGGSGGTNECRIAGTITKAADGTPIAGATVALNGTNTGATTTDANGAYALTGLLSGDTSIGVHQTGFDTVIANTRLNCNPQGNTALQYSPKLYASSQSPADANTASLSGIVVDARTNQPIAAAQLTFTTSTGVVRTAASQTDGRFAASGLDGASVQLTVAATGYQGLTAGYLLQPAQPMDLGQIRLRPPQVTQLSVDLQIVAVRRHTTQTDPQTLRVSGAIQVQVRNAGTQDATANVPVLAFQDGNGNGQYDVGSDTVLGQSTLASALAAGQSQTASISVAGLLPFRDAPIHVVVDPAGSVTEKDKANNVRSSAQDVMFTPTPGTFTPKLKWHWDGSNSPYPEYNQVMMAPVVGRVLDTNGDGRIDEADTPSVIFSTFTISESYNGGATIRVVDGKTGNHLLSIRDPIIAAAGNLAIADLDGDGQPEIVAITRNYEVVAYRNTGSKWWVSETTTSADGYPAWGAPFIADIDGDGKPEIVHGKTVLNFDGTTKWKASGAHVGSSFQNNGRFSIPLVADIQGEGIGQIVLGGSLYSATGQLLWHAPMDGFTALGDFGGSGTPSIAIVHAGVLSLLSATGQIMWSVNLPGGGMGGPPTIADMDGDGVPDIGVAGAAAYSVFRGDGSLLWSKGSQDGSSQITGSTVFDFDGDGVAEVLYADEIKLRVFKGTTGEVLWEQPNTSGTTIEYPLVVDADADGRADVVLVSNDYATIANATQYTHGVRVYEDANGGWVPTRSIWNQHAYSITNINDDLNVPRNPEPSWKSHNTFRLNRRMDADPRAIADLTASYVRIVDMGTQPGSRITVRLGNAGSYKVPAGTPVAIYNTDPALGQPAAQALVAQGVTQTVLDTGAYEDLVLVPALPLAQLSAQGTVWIVADDDGAGKHSLPDFDRSNNTVAADLGAMASSLQITVVTDKPAYAETDAATFTATVRNVGSFARQALVRFTVEDAAGRAVDILPLGAAIPVAPAANGQTQAPWTAAAVLADAYQVRAELITPQGVVYGSAIAPFAVQASTAAGSSSLNSTRISTDRSQYSATSTVLIQSRMANLSTNQLQDDLVLTTTVIAPNGQTVFSRAEAIAQATPRSQRQYQYSLAAASLAPGLYQAKLQLTGPSGAMLSASTTSFTLGDTQQTGAGVIGQLQANPSTVALGSETQLQLDIAHRGNAAISGATLRVRVLNPDTGAVLATFTQANVQLAVGASASYTWSWAATGTAGAVLPVAATIELNGSGTETALAQATVQLTASTALQPLTGTLTATPKNLHGGGAVQLNYSASNPNARSIDADFTLSVRTLGSSTVLEQWLLPQTLPANTSLAGNKGWTPTGAAGASYEARWTATVNGATTTLATDTFSTAAPGASVQAQIGSGSDARILLLVSCSTTDDGQAQSTSCDQAKAQALRAYLGSQGLKAVVVTTRAEFETEMRCGNFNVYWISGGADKLGDTAVKELREAAERGAGLLLDGAQSARDSILHSVLGVTAQGSGGQANPMASLGGTLYSAAGDLPVQGTPVRYSLNGATGQGTLTGGAVAIASRDVGKGRGLVFAFSFATLAAQAQASTDSQLTAVLQSSLRYLGSPAFNTGVPHAPQTLATELYNNGSEAVNVRLQATLPAGVQFLGASRASIPTAPVAQANGQTLVEWRIDLAAGASAVVSLHASAAAEGSYSVPILVETRSANGGANAPAASQTLTHSLVVRSAQNLAGDAGQLVAALQANGTADANAAVTARSAATSAAQLMGQGRHAESLLQWVAAADAVRSLSGSVNAQSKAEARLAIALALQAAERQLCQQWACITGELEFRVNNQTSRQVPLQDTIVGSRTIFNNCPPQIKDIPVTSLWINRRTGASVQNLWDNLTIPGHQNNRRDNGWQALGQDGDTIDVTLTAEWQGQLRHLDRDAFRIIVNPPVLSGGVTASPAHAKAGQNVNITRTIRNSGAMGKDIPVQLRTTNVTRGGSTQIWSQALTLNPGETSNGNTNWQVQGTTGDVVRVQLIATLGAAEQILGTVDFTVDP
ncbi:hypothetical protein GmRootA79_04030 [Acidovorax sp. A79]|uniref:carboxypeptidase regulatory-like domain-containing protein n=1 Tax=Acidovorax sp. A79 TaxID=3056107 RepID=UPI0034E8E982